MHEVWFGSPEHDSVINAGVPATAGTKEDKGVTVTVAVPACPAVSVFDGDRLETATTNDELHWEVTVCETEVEVEPL